MNNQRTISDWIGYFMTDRRSANVAQGTLDFYRKQLKYLKEFCQAEGVTQVEAITSDLLRRYLLHLEETGHNQGGIHAGFRTARTFLRWYDFEVEPPNWKNPIRRVKPPRQSDVILEPVELADVASLVSVCESHTFLGVRDRAILVCLLDTGCRATEFLNMDLADVDVDTGAIVIRQGKGRKYRQVYLGQKARKALRAYLRFHPNESGALWVSIHGKRLIYKDLRFMVRRRAEKAGVAEPTLHAFRRSFALNCLRSGMDIYTLKTLMGHAGLAILQRYLKQTEGDVLEAHRQHSPADKLS